ncbi:MAG TPA: peptidylprolyl isomerase [Gemmatimonadales bacterium]|nr:peptidylprolyl isomerase [Gemmatimonadales bacterium]
MRRIVVLLAASAALLTACGSFATHSDLAATAAGQDLSVQRVTDIMTAGKGIPLNAQTASLVADIWVDLTLFSQAVADNKLTLDSGFVAEATWPALVEDKARRMKDSLLAHAITVTDAEIDSAYKADKLRVSQHILIKVDSNASPAVKAAARKKIDDLLDQLHHGGNFAAIAKANSEDEGSAADSGMMAPVQKNFFVPSFDKAAWALKPGEMTGVITSPFGYHIIRRPTEDESRRMWRQGLYQLKASQQMVDSIFSNYMKNLGTTNDVQVDKDATARMRAALADMDNKRDDHGTITTYKGGSFTTADFVHWVQAATSNPQQGAQLLEQIKSAPDSMFPIFAKGLTGSQLLVRDADSKKIGISPADWKVLSDSFKIAVDSLKATLHLNTLDPKASNGERSKQAAKDVETYIDSMVRGAPLHLPPGMLAWTLRDHGKVTINGVALKRAVDLAQAKVGGDSASRPLPQAPPMDGGAMQPAPGGPPVPTSAGAKPATPPATKKP